MNQKVYIGFTKSLSRRKRQHRYLAESGSLYAFHAAIRKYGWSVFEFEELYFTSDKDHALNEVEPLLISRYDSMNPTCGYNMTVGGEGGSRGPMTDDHKKKIGDANRGKRASVITKEKNRKSHLGKKLILSEEQRRRKSECSKNAPRTKVWRDKTSNTLKGHLVSPERRKKISESLKQYYERKRNESVSS